MKRWIGAWHGAEGPPLPQVIAATAVFMLLLLWLFGPELVAYGRPAPALVASNPWAGHVVSPTSQPPCTEPVCEVDTVRAVAEPREWTMAGRLDLPSRC